jgi:hypothetical protein
MNNKKIDPFSTSVHIDLLTRTKEEELRDRTFTALDYLSLGEYVRRKRNKVLEIYNVTEADIQKYQKEWESIFGKTLKA